MSSFPSGENGCHVSVQEGLFLKLGYLRVL